ncbi:hypothetical protein J5X98_16290 [Leptothermofonsia sichuanensis E412]|uniref:hypothetical protein n=1 Tax=Leptothermofonsia sichuanensis TaxID=2917832 RepID=UPI001CA654C8|nr:hypothetical protein [Leptothermofonsia sichuanensis]QZZ18985.1 hypothetical protein J5X98_16290 [Leptothermofonsia sichuanensis E412]
MKIQQTPESLVIDSSHPSFAIFGTGCVFATMYMTIPLLAMGLAFILFSEQITLECRRFNSSQISCEFISSTVFQKKTIPIQLRGAEIERMNDGDGESYRLLLRTPTEKLSFTNYGSNELELKQLASQINDFVQYSELKVLKLRKDDRWTGYLWGGSLLLIGIGLLHIGLNFSKALRTKLLWLFDKNSGKFQIIEKTPSGKTQIVREWMLHQISQTGAVETEGMDGDRMYTLQLELQSGEKVRLPVSSATSKEYEIAAESIQKFLNLKASS